jgi:hypothetical protein
MVRKRDLSAQIHFIRNDQLNGFVKSLSELHGHNFLHMKSLIANSYEAIKTSKKVRDYLEKKIESKLRWRLYLILINHKVDAEISSFHIEYKNGELVISVDIDESAIQILNSNREISEATKAVLKEVAKYEGPFRFELDIPF